MNRDGAVCAAEGLGAMGSDGTQLFVASGHVILSAIGAIGVREATGLMLMPIEPGTVRVRTDQPLDAVAGDVVKGCWVTHEDLEVQRADGWITLTADPACARSLILLSTPAQREAHQHWMETLAAL